MKIFQTSLVLLFSVFMMSNSTAQTVYGTYNSSTGQATMTASAALITQKFKAELNDQGAQISDIRIIAYDNGTKFLLAAKVSNSKDKVGSLGVELVPGNNGGVVARTGGPSYKHTCTGNPCSNCEVTLNKFDVACACKGESGGTCNHTVEVTISVY